MITVLLLILVPADQPETFRVALHYGMTFYDDKGIFHRLEGPYSQYGWFYATKTMPAGLQTDREWIDQFTLVRQDELLSYLQEPNIVEPKDDGKPFVVAQTDTVRVRAQGISGSVIDIVIVGPAKVQAKRVIAQTRDGKPIVGLTVKEFDIIATGPGQVKATATIKPPQADAEATTKIWMYEVK